MRVCPAVCGRSIDRCVEDLELDWKWLDASATRSVLLYLDSCACTERKDWDGAFAVGQGSIRKRNWKQQLHAVQTHGVFLFVDTLPGFAYIAGDWTPQLGKLPQLFDVLVAVNETQAAILLRPRNRTRADRPANLLVRQVDAFPVQVLHQVGKTKTHLFCPHKNK
jgi:hypothetical protein